MRDAEASDAGRRDGGTPCAQPGRTGRCAVPGHPGRPYRVWVPRPLPERAPIVVALHGGGGTAAAAERGSCAGGDLGSPTCLHAVGAREGFVTVYPNGTENTDAPGVFRVWNAGGVDPYMCVAGRACEADLDDVGYLDDVLDHLASWLVVDPGRVYVAGLSNGGAMAYRYACERSRRVAAIAPIGAGNQFETGGTCLPEEPVALLHVHGTADPCWGFLGGEAGACIGNARGLLVSVRESVEGWAMRLGCDGDPTLRPGPERADDGIDVLETTYAGCRAPVHLLTVRGGGHTWVNGEQYFPPSRIGPSFADVTNEDLWAFFGSHRR